MEQTVDVFLTNLPRAVTENVIKNFFSAVGEVLKVKFIDDKKNAENKLCFVGFISIDKALEAVRIADKCNAFGQMMGAVISKKSMDCMDSKSNNNRTFNNNTNNNSFYRNKFNESNEDTRSDVQTSERFANVGRGRGTPSFQNSSHPSFSSSVILTDIKFKTKELCDVEIIDLPHLKFILARSLKHTNNSKSEITDLLNGINSSTNMLKAVGKAVVGESYLAKWDDECYYRAEMMEILNDGSYKVSFIDEGTSNDLVTELRQIPDGPLQQYPKQFTKITLAVPNESGLMQYIVEHSANKLPKIYWLGGYVGDVPVVNLFLGEEEIVDKYEKHIGYFLRSELTPKFDALSIYNRNVFDQYSLNKSLYRGCSDFVLTLRESKTININNRMHPVILPYAGDICLYERKTANRAIPVRCVIKRRDYLSFDIFLLDLGEVVNNISIDDLYAPADEDLTSLPDSIMCESETAFEDQVLFNMLSNLNAKITLGQYRGKNRYTVQIEELIVEKKMMKYPDIDPKDLIGNSYQILISHSTSPINFFVQINKPGNIMLLTDTHQKLNSHYPGTRFRSCQNLDIGQAVVAPYSPTNEGLGDYYRAIVIEHREATNEVHVFYIDYGNESWVLANQILDVDDALCAEPGLAVRCSLNVYINRDAWPHAVELFNALTGFDDDSGDTTELAMEVLREGSAGKLVVELTSHLRGVISATLLNKGVCTVIRSNRNTPQKPQLSNGDAKSSVRVCSTRSPKPNAAISSPKANLFLNSGSANEEYNSNENSALLKKIVVLEMRVKQLEEMIYL